MQELSKNEKKVVQILKENADNPLTYKEMADEVGVKSTNTISYYIKKLQRLGYLRVNPNNPRDYSILEEPDEAIVYLPVYAVARCGPKGILNEDAIIDKVAISTKYLPKKSTDIILAKAKGNSMIPCIKNNDLVVVRLVDNNYANDGDIVLASTDERGTFIKQIRIDNSTKTIFMFSLNNKYSPFSVSENTIRIHGVVKGTLFNYYK